MRKNIYYNKLRRYFYIKIVNKAEEKGLFLPVGKIKTKIDYIFQFYQKHYIFDVYRLTLRQMRNMYK